MVLHNHISIYQIHSCRTIDVLRVSILDMTYILGASDS
jgi:hypothetical protein